MNGYIVAPLRWFEDFFLKCWLLINHLPTTHCWLGTSNPISTKLARPTLNDSATPMPEVPNVDDRKWWEQLLADDRNQQGIRGIDETTYDASLIIDPELEKETFERMHEQANHRPRKVSCDGRSYNKTRYKPRNAITLSLVCLTNILAQSDLFKFVLRCACLRNEFRCRYWSKSWVASKAEHIVEILGLYIPFVF